MKSKRIRNLWYWVVAVFPSIVTCALLPSMPEQVPMHFGLTGQANRMGSKYEVLFVSVLPIICALIISLLLRSFSKEEKGLYNPDDYEDRKKRTSAIGLVLIVTFDAITLGLLYLALHL